MRYTILLHYPEMTPDDLGAGWEEGRRVFLAERADRAATAG